MRDPVPFDQSGQEMWPALGCLQLREAREEGATVFAFWSLGRLGPWAKEGPRKEAPGLFSGVSLLPGGMGLPRAQFGLLFYYF